MHAGLKQRVTLLDIAADAGVSRATVSLVIRNVPSVADSTRKRVQRSIKRLGYVYHRGAASLRMQQSHAIGDQPHAQPSRTCLPGGGTAGQAIDHRRSPVSQSDKVKFQINGAIARITLNRPEKLHALDPEMRN